MKIHIFGSAALVDSAHVEELDSGLQILINTRDKWTRYHRPGTSMEFVSQFEPGKDPVHDCITILYEDEDCEDDQNDECCEVVFEAETEHEAGLLRNQAYFQQNKDQLAVFKPYETAMNFVKQLGTYRRDASPKP